MAFTTACLIPEDGQLSRNAHFIEIIVLIMAIKIHHCQHCRVTHRNTAFRGSEMCKERLASFCDIVVIEFLPLPTPNFDFSPVECGSS